MEFKIFGTFTKSNGFIYRTDTYIQFGKSEKIIGACVLCNPGSASLKDSGVQESLEKFNGYKVIQGEAKEDYAIRQLIDILKGVYEEGLEGKFYILNLFTIKNADMAKAVKGMEDSINLKLLNEDFEFFQKLKSDIPWILVGWGCESKLKQKKEQWLKYLVENKVVFTGYHKEHSHYYHPLPRLMKKRAEYLEIIIPKIKAIISQCNI